MKNRSEEKINKHMLIGILIVAVIIGLFGVDYYNICGKYGISLNDEAWNVIAMMVIFIITYIVIDEEVKIEGGADMELVRLNK